MKASQNEFKDPSVSGDQTIRSLDDYFDQLPNFAGAMKTATDKVVPKQLDMSDAGFSNGPDTKKTGIYQDDEGKSNVWAVEPKMQVDENGSNFPFFAGASTVALVTVAAITGNITPNE